MKPANVVVRITPRAMRPKNDGGCNWGAPSPILVHQQSTGRRLIWWKGGSVWSGMYGMSRCSTYLQLVITATDDPLFHAGHRTQEWDILEAGRFSRARALGVKDKIDEFFGLDVDVASLTLKQTMVIE